MILKNLKDILKNSTDRYPQKIALKKSNAYTYSELSSMSRRIAGSLDKFGINKGDRVAILSDNSPEYGIAVFGITTSGAVIVLVDNTLSDDGIKKMLLDSKAKAIFMSKKFFDMIKKLKPFLTSLELLISLEGKKNDDNFPTIFDLAKSNEEKICEADPNDTAVLVHSAGILGVPMDVELTHANLIHQIKYLPDFVELYPEDVLLSLIPLYHMFEFTTGFLVPVYTGCTIAYSKKFVLSAFRTVKPTRVVCVPVILSSMLSFFHDRIEKSSPLAKRYFSVTFPIFGFLNKFGIKTPKLLVKPLHKILGSRVKTFVCGGAYLNPDLIKEYMRMGFTIMQGYGLTETAPVLSGCTVNANRIGSVGKPMPEDEIKIVKENEKEKEGEIYARGPNIMKGYFDAPKVTAQVKSEDGWLKTGDLGYTDRDGYLYITGVVKNIIVTNGGENVNPIEIEEEVGKSPFIKEICVVGKPIIKGARSGEKITYGVVYPDYKYFQKSDESLEKDYITEVIRKEITKYCLNLPEYKRMKNFETWDEELPRTGTGAMKRKEILNAVILHKLKEQKKIQKNSENIVLKDDKVSLKLKKIVAKVAGIRPSEITSQSNINDELYLDSMMKLELLMEIEDEFNIQVSDEVTFKVTCFAELVEFIRKALQNPASVYIDDQLINQIMNGNPLVRASRVFIHIFYFAFMKLCFKLKTGGIKNLPKGNFIIVSNHSSHLDIFSLMSAIPYTRVRDFYIPAARDYFYKSPSKQFLLHLALNTFPFDRFGNFLVGVRIATELLKRGKALIVFPEGGRTETGEIQRFKAGIGTLSYDLNIPVIPTYIKGAYDIFPKGVKIPRFGNISVYFGKPIIPGKFKKLEKKKSLMEIYSTIADRCREEVLNLENSLN